MTMKQFKTALGFSLILVTFNSYATSLQNQNISKSCVSVESEKDKKSRLQRGEERVDIFVGLNSFTAYDEGSQALHHQSNERPSPLPSTLNLNSPL